MGTGGDNVPALIPRGAQGAAVSLPQLPAGLWEATPAVPAPNFSLAPSQGHPWAPPPPRAAGPMSRPLGPLGPRAVTCPAGLQLLLVLPSPLGSAVREPHLGRGREMRLPPPAHPTAPGPGSAPAPWHGSEPRDAGSSHPGSGRGHGCDTGRERSLIPDTDTGTDPGTGRGKGLILGMDADVGMDTGMVKGRVLIPNIDMDRAKGKKSPGVCGL